MTWKNNKPPGGYVHKPASGQPASGIPARGEGWGGDAGGLKPEFSAEYQPAGEAKSAGKEAAKTARDVAKTHAVAMAELLAAIAKDPTAPPGTRVDAANKLIERAEGKAAQSVDMTSRGERVGYVIPVPPEIEDAAEWATRHKPH